MKKYNTRTALFETCAVESYRPVIYALADALRKLGYSITFWDRRDPVTANSLIFWWGCDIQEAQRLKVVNARAIPFYMERGWLMDRDSCFQLDTRGVGGNASWVEESLVVSDGGDQSALSPRVGGDLLVVLRYERPNRKTDNVESLSPYFKDNLAWLNFLASESSLPLRVRPHPVTPARCNWPLKTLVKSRGWTWEEPDRSGVLGFHGMGDFLRSCRKAMAVAVIDSTAGAWAMELGIPVLCYGKQVYRHRGVVYCLDNTPGTTRAVTRELFLGGTSILHTYVDTMISKIKTHQWYPQDAHTFCERLEQEFGL